MWCWVVWWGLFLAQPQAGVKRGTRGLGSLRVCDLRVGSGNQECVESGLFSCRRQSFHWLQNQSRSPRAANGTLSAPTRALKEIRDLYEDTG